MKWSDAKSDRSRLLIPASGVSAAAGEIDRQQVAR
jgi:hypothetical protein